MRLIYPDGFWIEYEFGAKDGLPAKIIYLRKRKNADTGLMEEETEEDRLEKPITIEGVTSPWVIDHFYCGQTNDSHQLRISRLQQAHRGFTLHQTRHRQSNKIASVNSPVARPGAQASCLLLSKHIR